MSVRDRTSCYRIAFFLAGISLWICVGAARSEERFSERDRRCDHFHSRESLRAYAIHHSPLVAEIDRGYAEQLASALAKETLENPELQLEKTFTRMKIGGADDPQTQASIGQPLRFSDFGARSEVAKLMRQAGDLEKRGRLMELIQTVTLRYETLAAYQRLETVLAERDARASAKIVTMREGVRKGLLTEGDLFLLQGERYRFQAQGKSIAATVAVLQNELAKATGAPCEIIAQTSDEIPTLPTVSDLLKRATESDLGERVRVHLMNTLAVEQVRLAELEAYPAITPRLLYQHTNDGGDFVGAGVVVSLPFWNRNQGERLKALADQRVAVTRSAALANGSLEAQIAALRDAVARSEEQVQMFRQKIIPSFEKASQFQERLFQQGRGNVLQSWQTERTLTEVYTQSVQAFLDARALRMSLSALVGEEV